MALRLTLWMVPDFSHKTMLSHLKQFYEAVLKINYINEMSLKDFLPNWINIVGEFHLAPKTIISR